MEGYAVKFSHGRGDRGCFIVHGSRELRSGRLMSVDDVARELREVFDGVGEWFVGGGVEVGGAWFDHPLVKSDAGIMATWEEGFDEYVEAVHHHGSVGCG